MIDELGVQGNDLVAPVDRGPGELVPDVDAQPRPFPEDPETLPPGVVQVLEIFVQALAVADLTGDAIVLDLPVGRRGHRQVDAGVTYLRHGPAVAEIDFGPVRHE